MFGTFLLVDVTLADEASGVGVHQLYRVETTSAVKLSSATCQFGLECELLVKRYG
jgi:hypothetical protein